MPLSTLLSIPSARTMLPSFSREGSASWFFLPPAQKAEWAEGWRYWVYRWGETCCHRSDIIAVPSQLPYTELEKVSGIEEAKHYLRQKLRELRF